MIAVAYFLPESPMFYLSQTNNKQAIESLNSIIWTNEAENLTEQEISAIKENKGNYIENLFWKNSYLNQTIIMCIHMYTVGIGIFSVYYSIPLRQDFEFKGQDFGIYVIFLSFIIGLALIISFILSKQNKFDQIQQMILLCIIVAFLSLIGHAVDPNNSVKLISKLMFLFSFVNFLTGLIYISQNYTTQIKTVCIGFCLASFFWAGNRTWDFIYETDCDYLAPWGKILIGNIITAIFLYFFIRPEMHMKQVKKEESQQDQSLEPNKDEKQPEAVSENDKMEEQQSQSKQQNVEHQNQQDEANQSNSPSNQEAEEIQFQPFTMEENFEESQIKDSQQKYQINSEFQETSQKSFQKIEQYEENFESSDQNAALQENNESEDDQIDEVQSVPQSNSQVLYDQPKRWLVRRETRVEVKE